MTFYTIYKITNLINGMIYIGFHSTELLTDDYMGSGTNIIKAIKKYGTSNFKKEILFVFETEKEMLDKERELVNEQFIAREDTYNIILGGGGFYVKHCVAVKDKYGNTLSVNKNDPRYLSGELVGVSKGLVVVKDKNNNHFQISKNDPRYLSGELTHVSKGRKLGKYKKRKPRKIVNNRGENNSIGGKIGMTHFTTYKRKYVCKEEVNQYLENDWVIGWIKKTNRVANSIGLPN